MTRYTTYDYLKVNNDLDLDGAAAIAGDVTIAGDLTVTGAIAGAVETKNYSLGKPVVADVDRVVTSTNMKVGTYTVAAQPDVPRNITVTVTAGDTADTMGTITIVGTDSADAVISETITPEAGETVAGEKAFKSVTSVTGAGWVIDAAEGTNDTITVGIGTVLGLPLALSDADHIVFGTLDYVMAAHNPEADGTLSGTTVDLSSGTYDGSKTARVFVTGG